jgi:hypothetical protein
MGLFAATKEAFDEKLRVIARQRASDKQAGDEPKNRAVHKRAKHGSK